MHVQVTQADIDAGIRKDCKRCPVALAVQRLYPEHEVKVGVTSIYIIKSGITSRYRMPNEIAIRIAQFDDGRPMTLMEFEAPWVESQA